MFEQLVIITPELMLALLAFFSVLAGVFLRFKKIIIILIVLSCFFIISYIIKNYNLSLVGFNGSYVINKNICIIKALLLGFTITSILVYFGYCSICSTHLKIEFIVLMLLSTLGIYISISAKNFLLLFCGFELQALPAYALAAFNINNYKSSEAALKYFILGALISCITLLGISFIYGFGGSINFNIIREVLGNTSNFNLGLIIGIVFMLSGICFKLSAAPLHIWTPDVYEGAPITAVNFFSTVQKIGALAILLNIINSVIYDFTNISVDLIKIISILSMLIGSFGALRQTSLKRLMAYSTILNIGYVLIGVASHNSDGDIAAQLYILVYIVGATGFFACLIALLGAKSEDATFDNINGIAYTKKAIAGAITIIIFSMIGVPPLGGFFGKYFIFYNAILNREFLLAFIGILTSVVATFYYLKIIKSMYFVENNIEIKRIPTNNILLLITILSVSFLMFFSFFATSFIQSFHP